MAREIMNASCPDHPGMICIVSSLGLHLSMPTTIDTTVGATDWLNVTCGEGGVIEKVSDSPLQFIIKV